MMHRAWSSIVEVPYCFSRSYIKFRGHTALKIVEFDPNWAFPDCNSSLNSPMAMKCCTKLETVKERCPIVFQGHPSNFKVTRYKTSPILTQIGYFRTIGRSQLSNPSDLPCFYGTNWSPAASSGSGVPWVTLGTTLRGVVWRTSRNGSCTHFIMPGWRYRPKSSNWSTRGSLISSGKFPSAIIRSWQNCALNISAIFDAPTLVSLIVKHVWLLTQWKKIPGVLFDPSQVIARRLAAESGHCQVKSPPTNSMLFVSQVNASWLAIHS